MNENALPDIGPYRFVTRIAIGGMAEVFRALRRQSAGADRAVVIKRMLPRVAAEPEGRAMFDREARLGMRIRHDNVVEVLDHGVDGGLPYLVLEYVFGVDLRRLLRFVARSGRALPPPLAAWIAAELLSGLHAVHEAKDERGAPLHVVHRDVSPSNVFLSVHGDVKLGDLGIAIPLRRDSVRTPPAGKRAATAKGKLGYLAPEQVAGEDGTPRSDVFSAAVIASELLLGRPLFPGGTELAVLLAIAEADVSALRAIAPTLPPGLVDALLPALARAPADRTPSAEALRATLVALVGPNAAPLRAELGHLVVTVLDAAEGDVDRESLARTIEGDERALPPGSFPTPAKGLDRPSARDPARLFDLDSPGAGAAHYEVRSAGVAHGPWSYARVVQAVRTSEIDAASAVSVDGGPPRALADVPELARHVPPSSRVPSVPPASAVDRSPSPAPETAEVFDLARGVGPALLDLLVARETGLLLCERRGVRKEVYVERGVPTFVTSNRLEELLGERLVRDGVVDRSELDLALAVMPRFEGRLGDTLVALGLVDPLVLFRQIEEQVREKLIETFSWSEGRAALYRDVEPPERSFPLRLDAWALLEEGMHRRAQEGLESADRRPGRRVIAQSVPGVALPEHLERLAESLATPRTLAEIEAASPDAARAYAAVLLLVGVGAARWLP